MSTTNQIHDIIRREFQVEPGIRIKDTDELSVHCHGDSSRILLARALSEAFDIDVTFTEIKQKRSIGDIQLLVLFKESAKQRNGSGKRPGFSGYSSSNTILPF